MIRPSASLILARRAASVTTGCDFEVLLLKRSSLGSFKACHVYPGGAVDPHDSGHQADKYRICAVRETFEETGIYCGAESNRLSSRQAAQWRSRIHGNAEKFKLFQEAYAATDIQLESLLLWSHWITPVQEAKRFETKFFLKVLSPENIDNILAHESAGKLTPFILKMAKNLCCSNGCLPPWLWKSLTGETYPCFPRNSVRFRI